MGRKRGKSVPATESAPMQWTLLGGRHVPGERRQTAFTHTAAMFEHQGLLSSDSKKVKSVSINATMCWVEPMGTCTISLVITVILKIVRLVHL